MKNIHILPTDKPSRLIRFFTNKYYLCKEILPIQDEERYMNIYITSDEEIKRGDYKYHHVTGVRKALVDGNYTNQFKIILSTDQDLIKDGVQAIDDEFLEWFVKNPSCEEVEVGYGWIRLTETDNEGYWVSIPNKQFEMQQEEPKQKQKQHLIEIMRGDEELGLYDEPQETLKKASLQYRLSTNNKMGIEQVAFESGAKWQQERMYSEEEVLELLQKALTHQDDGEIGSLVTVQGQIRTANFYSWFEQFKKK